MRSALGREDVREGGRMSETEDRGRDGGSGGNEAEEEKKKRKRASKNRR